MSCCLLRACAFVALVGLSVLPDTASAACVPYADYVQPLDVQYPDGYVRSMAYQAPFLYAAGDSRRLIVLDCSDPANLAEAGTLGLPGAAGKLALQGDVAAVTFTDSAILQLLGIADPTHPALLGAVEIPAAPRSVALSATHAYVPAWDYMQSNHGVYVVDLSDPLTPEVVGRAEVGDYPHNVVLEGSYAYVIDAWGLTVLDLTAPAAPVPLGSVVIPGDARYLAVRHPYVFVVCDAEEYPAPGNGLYLVDVSDPLAPWIAGTLTAEEAPHQGIGLWEDYALVGTYGAGFAMIDISSPSAPTIAARIGVQHGASDFCVDGSLLFAGPASIASYRLSELLTPGPVAVVPETPGTRVIATLGDHAYGVRDQGKDFCVVDLTDPVSPRVTGTLPLDLALPTAVTVSESPDAGRHAYVGAGVSGEGVHIIDVADPTAPIHEGFIPLVHSPTDLDVEGSRLYVMAGFLGLLIYDITDPIRPLYQSSLTFGYSPQVVRAADKILYIGRRTAGAGELIIVDAADPLAPVILGTSDVPEIPFDFRIDGSLLYIADATEGLLIMDVGDPAHPRLVSRLRTTENCRALALRDGRAYLAHTGETGGLHVVDVSDPAAPRLTGYYPARLPCDVEVVSDHLLMATYNEDLEVVPPDCGYPSVGVLDVAVGAAASPVPRIVLGANPSRRPASIVLQMPHSAEARVTVHDLQGRLLRDLHAGPLASGSHMLRWDGCNRLGHRVPNGAYYVRVRAGRESFGQSLILIQ